jgi:hypothetical protein
MARGEARGVAEQSAAVRITWPGWVGGREGGGLDGFNPGVQMGRLV